MSFLKMLIGGGSPQGQSVLTKMLDPDWRKGPRGRFSRLFDIDLDCFFMEGKGGVYVLWHKGIQSAWVYVGFTDSLSAALGAAKDNPEFRQYDVNGGLYYSWSPILPEMRYGVVTYLRQKLDPLYDSFLKESLPEADDDGNPIKPIAVLLPR